MCCGRKAKRSVRRAKSRLMKRKPNGGVEHIFNFDEKQHEEVVLPENIRNSDEDSVPYVQDQE